MNLSKLLTYSLLTFLIWVMAVQNPVISQCGIIGKTVITDEENDMPDTTLLQIVIENAVNNNLSHPLQGLCAVGLRFKHPFVKELALELISPSGQKVTLVGGNISAYFTGFVTWDVKFVQSPPEGTAVPDPGFSEVWENDQDWENFKTYKGDYYPHTGRLQNFNNGPVNGTWTLRCIDFADFGEGEILGFQLFFCDDDGLSCKECKLDAGFYPLADIDACTGSQNLHINSNKQFLIHPPVSGSNLIYSNIIFYNSRIYEYAQSPDLRLSPPGLYTICPLQYASVEAGILPGTGSIHSPESINLLFGNSCATLSDSCLTINIEDNSNVTVLDSTICKGDSVVINNQTFTDEGSYIIRIPNGICDSVVELRLKTINIQIGISSDRDSLNCFNNTISLIADATVNASGSLSYFWSGKNHNVDTDPNEVIVDISKPDIYYVSLSGVFGGLSCSVIDSIEIFADNSVPVTTLDADTLTCLFPQSEIRITSSRIISNTVWESEDGFPVTKTGFNAIVENAGKYRVIVIADNGCSVIDSITIQEDKTVSSPQISSDTLTCSRIVGNIRLIHPDQKIYSYQWTGVNPGTENQKEPSVGNPGVISLTLTDEINGCSAIFETETLQDIVKPEIIRIIADTITCNRTFINPEVQSDIEIKSYQWNGPGLNSSLPSPSIQQGGAFTVRITGPNGCVKDSFFIVETDTAKATLTLMVDKLTCNRFEVNITITSDQEILNYIWSGPGGFSSIEASPSVNSTGNYFVTVTTVNDCKAIGQITVLNDEDIPFVFFEAEPISCIDDTVTIMTTSLPGRDFSYNWSGPGVLNPVLQNTMVTEPGNYQVTVTDVNTSCTSTFSVNVGDNRIYPDVSLQSEILNCVKDSVQILLTSDMPLQSIRFTGPDGFVSTAQSPFIRKEGWYFAEFTNMLECSGKDSILIERNDRFPLISTGNYVIQCQQDSIQLEGNSDISGTIYTWSGPSGLNKIGKQVFVYSGGIYQLTGIAPNLCATSITFEVLYDTLRPDLSIVSPDVLTCLSPVTEVNAISQTTGVQFIWTGPDNFTGNVVQLDKPGIYNLKATGPNQCSESLIFEVTENKTFPEFTITADTLTCSLEAGLIVLSSSTENTVIWNSDNPQITGANIRQFETNITGTYNFSIVNTEQCITEGSVEVIRDVRIPHIQSFSSDSITCENATVTIAVNISTPVESYLWDGPAITDTFGAAITVNDAGIYLLRITGKNGCIKDTSFVIIKNRELPEFTTFTDTLSCENGKINIGVNPISNVISYKWEGPGFTSTSRNPIVFTPGDYTVTVTNANGCSSTALVVVAGDFERPVFEFPEQIKLPCKGTPATLQVQSGASFSRYKWTFPDASTSNEAMPLTKGEGQYSVQIVGKNGCLSETKMFVAILENNKPDFRTHNDTLNCIKVTGVLKVTSGLSSLIFSWSGPDQSVYSGDIIGVNIPGEYRLVISDSLLCSDTAFVLLSLDTLSPGHHIRQQGAIVCESKMVTLTAENGDPGRNYTYSWNTTNGNIISSNELDAINVNNTGDYNLLVTDRGNGCTAIKSFTVIETDPPLTAIEAKVTPPACSEYQNGSINITGIDGYPPFSIIMNGQNFGERQTFSFLSPGNYIFRIRDALGCTFDTTIMLENAVDPIIILPSELNILFGDSVEIIADISPTDPVGWESQWSTGNLVLCTGCSTTTVMPFINTLYTFEMSYEGRCKRTASVQVKVKNDLNTSVPNIFRPGSGTGNDIFYIPQIRGIEKIISMIVIDKWAEPVFASFDHLPGDASFGWDGKFNGKEAATGVYVIVVEMLLSNGQKYRYLGDLTLLR